MNKDTDLEVKRPGLLHLISIIRESINGQVLTVTLPANFKVCAAYASASYGRQAK